MKSRGKRYKIEANTPQAFNPPNYSRVQKPHNPRKDLNPYKYTSAPQNPLKTPLKCEIRHNIGLLQERQSSKGTKGRDKGTEHTTIGADKPRTPDHLPQVGTMKGRHGTHPRHPLCTHLSKIY